MITSDICRKLYKDTCTILINIVGIRTLTFNTIGKIHFMNHSLYLPAKILIIYYLKIIQLFLNSYLSKFFTI